VTGPPSAVATTTPSIPEGWTTTVTVCTHCAATPTTVTLTKPIATTTAQATPEPSSPAGGETWTETWTTTVTYCPRCGPNGSTITIPYTPTATPTGASGQGEGSDSPKPTSTSTATLVVVGHSKSIGKASSTPYQPSWTPTSAAHPTGTASQVQSSPSGTQEGVSPIYTGAASRSGVTNFIAIFMTVLASYVFLI
jgi:chitinase